MNPIGSGNERRYPPQLGRESSEDSSNPAIQLYGRRFHKDQTPVEYLAEFLLVFASPKGVGSSATYSFELEQGEGPPKYWPKSRIALKLFAFFPSSKLETRHPVHQGAYMQALAAIKNHIGGSSEDRDEAVRLLQSLFSGFVGVARNRTWVTHSFLPASPELLSREVNWLHSKAVRAHDLCSWADSREFFAVDRHNFMARGGELLFLQLASVFSGNELNLVKELQSAPGYEHVSSVDICELKNAIEVGLRGVLEEAVGPIGSVAQFVGSCLSDLEFEELDAGAHLGWVPSASAPEAFLFAVELNNVCRSTLGPFEKIDLLRLLCCMHVLRSLCFQAQRVDGQANASGGFAGGYAWIVAGPDSERSSSGRKLAQRSFDRVEEVLYRVLRTVGQTYGDDDVKYTEADKHGFQIFRKLAKEIGLVVPRTGRGQRFVLTPQLVRLLVAATVAPGERIRLTDFHARVYAHFGIALGNHQLADALSWVGNEAGARDYAVAGDTSWVEEALQQGGFLVELSDAVSIVHNPGNAE
jgi:hypothetical protein